MSEEIKTTENQITEQATTHTASEWNEFTTAFVKNLYSATFRNALNLRNLRRRFGTDISEDLSAYMSFLDMCGDRIPPKEDIYYLIACLFVEVEKPNKIDLDNKPVRFEYLLKRIYGNTETTNQKISHFINTDYSNKTVFIPQFVHLARRAVKEIHSNERLDYVSLIKDLCFWDAEEHLTRKKWSRTIVLNIPEKDSSDKEEDIER